jgi:hypothetical protein
MNQSILSVLCFILILLIGAGFVFGTKIGRRRNWTTPIFLGSILGFGAFLLFLAVATENWRSLIGLIGVALTVIMFVYGKTIGKRRLWLTPSTLGIIFAIATVIGYAIIMRVTWRFI